MAEYEKRGYLLEDYRLFHMKDQGIRVDYHYHEFCKLLLLISGGGSYVVDGQRYQLQPGDAVLIGSGRVHKPELDCGQDSQRIILYICPTFLARESTDNYSLADCFADRHSHVLRPDSTQWQTLLAMATALEQTLSQQVPEREVLAKTQLLQLLIQLQRMRSQADRPEPLQPKNDRILDIMRYLDTHLTEDLDIDHLAETFYISKYHMMRLFHRETGTTIHTYLSQRRLQLAKTLIGQGVRATEVCYRCGFRSYSSFSRAYGKQYGTTPTGKKDPSIAKGATYE